MVAWVYGMMFLLSSLYVGMKFSFNDEMISNDFLLFKTIKIDSVAAILYST
jgi:hypothetical protein